MLFVGIDVASDKHDATIISEHGEVLSDTFTFSNNSQGFKKLHMEINSHTESLDVCIGMEGTGIYHQNLADFLFDKGFMVFVENANKIHHFKESRSVRRTKTDPVDSLAITEYVMFFYNKLIPYTPKVYNTNELKSLSRLRFNKLRNLSKSKTELKRLLMITFPEFVKHFDPFSKWALNLFPTYKSIDKISRLHTKTLSSIIKVKSDRLSKAILLKDIASNTIGLKSKTKEIEINACIADILHFQSQIEEIDKEIKILMKDYENITSIPGVGIITGAIIIGEIGDINRFSSKQKLLAFAGCDPSIYESGKFKSKNNKISKRGSKYLRSALFMSTRVACVGTCKENKFRRKYLEKYKTKHHNSAVFHVAKNMLNTIYSLLKSGEFYDDAII